MSARDSRRKPDQDDYHIIFLRITKAEYRRLREKIIRHERETGERLSQQAVLSAALSAHLDQDESIRRQSSLSMRRIEMTRRKAGVV
jgi:hypothetical protein